MTSPSFDFGDDLGAQLAEVPIEEALFVTERAVWELAESNVGRQPGRLVHVPTMDIDRLRSLEREAAGARTVVGVGGGSCIDAAKYLGWKARLPVVAIPSIASVDAVVTSAVAVRVNRRVRYIGNMAPDHVVVNIPLVQSAPKHLNRAGIADVLSIHTASADWRLAADAQRDVYDVTIANEAAAILERMFTHTEALAAVSAQGIRTLIEAFWDETVLCVEWGSARPEEGSEHFFVYNLERVTGRHFVHGEIVCLGVLLMAHLQENRPERVHELLDSVGVRYRPSQLGITPDELETTIRTLPAFVADDRLPYSVIDARAEELVSRLQPLVDTLGADG